MRRGFVIVILKSARYLTTALLSTLPLLTLAVTPGCAVPQSQNVQGRTGQVPEPITQRNYYIYLPKDYTASRAYPLVVAIHGMKPFDNAFPQLETWRKICDDNGWIAIAPQLESCDIANQFPFRRIDKSILDDESLIVSSVQDACRKYSIDTRYVMITGWSSGGYLIHYTAARHPELFTLAAPQGANFSEEIMPQYLTEASRQMPIYIYHGSADLPMVIKDCNAAAQWYTRHGYQNVKMDEAPGGHERHPELAANYFANLIRSDTRAGVASRTFGGSADGTWLGTPSAGPVSLAAAATPAAPAKLAVSPKIASPEPSTLTGRPGPSAGISNRDTSRLDAASAARPPVPPPAPLAPPGQPVASVTGRTGLAAPTGNPALVPPRAVDEPPIVTSGEVRPPVRTQPLVAPPAPGRVNLAPSPDTVVAKSSSGPTTPPGKGPVIAENRDAAPPPTWSEARVPANPTNFGPSNQADSPIAIISGATGAPPSGDADPYSWERVGPSRRPVEATRFPSPGKPVTTPAQPTPPPSPAGSAPVTVLVPASDSASTNAARLGPPMVVTAAPRPPVATASLGKAAKSDDSPAGNIGKEMISPLGPPESPGLSRPGNGVGQDSQDSQGRGFQPRLTVIGDSSPGSRTAGIDLPLAPAPAAVNPQTRSVSPRAGKPLTEIERAAAAPVTADPVVPTLAVAAPLPLTPGQLDPTTAAPGPAADSANPVAKLAPGAGLAASTARPSPASGPQAVPASSNVLGVRILPSVQEGTAPMTVEFRAEMLGTKSPIVRYQWRVEGGLFSTSHFGVLTLQRPGSYQIDLVVTDAAGNTYRGKTTIRMN